jgi:hypothetical protein
MRRPLLPLAFAVVIGIGVVASVPAAAQLDGDTEVTVGSPDGPFSRNKQNEPAVAIDANHPNVIAAGSNDNIDMEACNAGADNTCPFTDGVGGSGIHFSFDSGATWMQPTYTGLTARSPFCDGVVGDDDPPCTPQVGPIGTVPNYFENGLISDGDPAVAFGPVFADGEFSWANGTRLYYANLTSKIDPNAFSGPEAIFVARIDGPAATGLTPAIVADQANWSDPVKASKQNSALFADKEQIWADNAESSAFFGNAYVCYAAFRSPNFASQPLIVATSTDGGDTWINRQVTPATNNINTPLGFGRSGCTVRTDSEGTVFVFVYQFAFGFPGVGQIQLIKSFDGGDHWTRPRNIFTAVDTCNAFEPAIGRCVQDGIGGARNDLSPAPSIDIANGAPTGADPTDQIVLTWVDGGDGLNNEHVMFTTSTDAGDTWSDVREIEQPGDRGYYSAPAISPNGTDVYLVYNAFTTPFRNNTTDIRGLVGVVLHADVAGGVVGDFVEIHRGVEGDPRSSAQNNLAGEFLGDYVYAAASRDYGVAVWNDSRAGGVCDAINTFRQDLHDAVVNGTALPTAPAVQQECPLTFGNSDIFGWSGVDPTP